MQTPIDDLFSRGSKDESDLYLLVWFPETLSCLFAGWTISKILQLITMSRSNMLSTSFIIQTINEHGCSNFLWTVFFSRSFLAVCLVMIVTIMQVLAPGDRNTNHNHKTDNTIHVLGSSGGRGVAISEVFAAKSYWDKILILEYACVCMCFLYENNEVSRVPNTFMFMYILIRLFL